MPFPVSCQCGQQFVAQDQLDGNTVPCPSCGRSLRIARQVTTNRGSVSKRAAISVTCQCGRLYRVAANLAGRDMRCTACGFVLHVPAPGEPAPLSDPLAAAAYLQPAARPHTAMPTRPRPANQDYGRLVKNLAIAFGVLAGLIVLWVGGYLVYRSIPWDRLGTDWNVAQSPADGEAGAPSDTTPTDPQSSGTAMPWPDAGFSGPGTDGISESSDIDSGDSEDGATGSSPTPVPELADGGDAASLPSALIRWHNEPSAWNGGLRRVGAAGPPVTHYSWLCGLLPYLGHQGVYDKFDFAKSWVDEPNLHLTATVIPEFLNPADERQRYDGYPFKGMALTHFVGMSGIEDRRTVVAASLPRTDPRAGVFGYDEIARREDITDGTSNTVMILGSGELAAPWTLGGGATVRGAREPYFDRLSGFGSRGRNSPGTLAVMADGSVRFISSDIDPAAFRALCTIRGGETVDIGRWLEAADLGRQGVAIPRFEGQGNE